MRSLMLTIFGIQTCVIAVLVRDLLQSADSFPVWFTPILLLACVLMLAVIGSYGKSVFCDWNETAFSELWISRFIAFGIALAILASTALHSFYPFRTDTFQQIASIPLTVIGPGPRLKFNFLFGAICFAISLILVALQIAGKQNAVSFGFIFLAGLLLFPNDNCENNFNRTWNQWIGASPLMFLPASVAALVGVAGMRGFFPRWSLFFVLCVAGMMLLLGLSHMYKISW
jgi:hypothetical protein